MKHKSSKVKKVVILGIVLVALVLGLSYIMGFYGNILQEQPKPDEESLISVSPHSLSEPAEVVTPDEPELTIEEILQDKVTTILDSMTLHEKVCQLFVVSPEALSTTEAVTDASSVKVGLESYPVGGIIYSTKNFVSKEQTTNMISTAQSYNKIPLLITCDEEGGRVARLMNTVGTTKIGPMMDYKDAGGETAYSNAYTIGSDMKALGFNLDLAPVADVWSNKNNTVIGDRAYSDDFSQAAKLIPPAVNGFHDAEIACALKHFPGHGDTIIDSHYGVPNISKSFNDIEKEELLPFQAGINEGADIVLLGHLVIPDIDSEMILFSSKWINDILRERMGFNGVVMTDGMEMQAITDNYTSGKAAVKALSAGVDIILLPDDMESAVEAIKDAVEIGKISEKQIDEALMRILKLKNKWSNLE